MFAPFEMEFSNWLAKVWNDVDGQSSRTPRIYLSVNVSELVSKAVYMRNKKWSRLLQDASQRY